MEKIEEEITNNKSNICYSSVFSNKKLTCEKLRSSSLNVLIRNIRSLNQILEIILDSNESHDLRRDSKMGIYKAFLLQQTGNTADSVEIQDIVKAQEVFYDIREYLFDSLRLKYISGRKLNSLHIKKMGGPLN
jgi:hypothetical protein